MVQYEKRPKTYWKGNKAMSLEDQTPIRDVLLKRVIPLLKEFRGSIHVRDYEIVLKSWNVPAPSGATIECNAWALIVITNGALIGAKHYISFVWTFGNSPQVPDDSTLRQGIKEMFQRIRMMQQKQLTDNTPPAGSPN
jgi:hypothetical protein